MPEYERKNEITAAKRGGAGVQRRRVFCFAPQNKKI
jgi:hypothetical protein